LITLLDYYKGYAKALSGDEAAAKKSFEKAAAESTDWVFPNKLEDILVLEKAIALNPADGHAYYYLGNLYYDKMIYDEAIADWDQAAAKTYFATATIGTDQPAGMMYYNDQPADMILFEEDWNRRNKAHCHYLIGLGRLGYGDWKHASEEFAQAIVLEPTHWNAIRYQKLAEENCIKSS
jgi:tetratricopeptide (TPR) repeat protein